MVRIELAEGEADTLREMLEDWLGELRMEIAGTDRLEYREGLKEREALIKRVIEDLRAARSR